MTSPAYSQGRRAALTAFKLGEWNWELTGRKIPKDAIPGDNGLRAFGTRFEESGRPSRAVGQAFDALSSTKPSDFINAGNEAMVGATG